MLFGNKDIAEFIDSNFEPVWQSVAPVPIVTVDFGNGNRITRTFRGNIATYVLCPDGTVVDILPGLLQPVSYKQLLQRTLPLCRKIEAQPSSKLSVLAEFHRRSANRVGTLTLSDLKAGCLPLQTTSVNAKLLMNDTILNEIHSHREIHQRLVSESDPTLPALTTWVYEHVLDVKLSDPYLGFKALLTDKKGELSNRPRR